MMRRTRILIYEGDDNWVNRTISKSLANGIFKTRFGYIQVIDVEAEQALQVEFRGHADSFTNVDEVADADNK